MFKKFRLKQKLLVLIKTRFVL